MPAAQDETPGEDASTSASDHAEPPRDEEKASARSQSEPPPPAETKASVPPAGAPAGESFATRFGLDWGKTTIRLFREDHLLLVLFVVLSISALSPIFLTPILPLVDLGSNIGAAGLLPAALFKKGIIGEYYRINPVPTPYWTAYSIMAVGSALFGPLFGAKLIVAIDVVLLPAGAIRLAHALGRNPRIGLFAFLLCWETNLYWGWVSFSLGMAFALFALARLVEVKTTRDAWRMFPLAFLVAFTHIHAVTLLGVVGVLMAFTRRPLFRGLVMQAIGLLGTTLVLLPWVVQRFRGGGGGAPGSFTYAFPPVTERITNLYATSVAVLPLRNGPQITVAVFFCLLMAPAILGAVPQTRTSTRRAWSAVALLVGTLGLYLILPFAVSGPLTHWWTYPRYATYALLAMFLLPRPRLDGAYAWLLAPVLALAALQHHAVRAQFARIGLGARPFVTIIEAMEPNKKMLTLDYETADPEVVHEPWGQMHGYAAAAKGLYDGHVFDEPNNPLLFRQDKKIPHPGGGGWWPLNDFSMDAHGKHYDYIIVRGLSHDPLRNVKEQAGVRVQMLKEAGTWRLYGVTKL